MQSVFKRRTYGTIPAFFYGKLAASCKASHFTVKSSGVVLCKQCFPINQLQSEKQRHESACVDAQADPKFRCSLTLLGFFLMALFGTSVPNMQRCIQLILLR